MWQISRDSASRIEDLVGEWPVVRAGFFRLAGTVNLRQCVGLVATSLAEIGKQEASDIDA